MEFVLVKNNKEMMECNGVQNLVTGVHGQINFCTPVPNVTESSV